MKIGIIRMQGAISEHTEILKKLNVSVVLVKNREDLDKVSGLIIPGGESTTISTLLVKSGMFNKIRRMGRDGLPIFGTCAGLILLAKKGDSEAMKTEQRLLGLMDMEVIRNAFGRQRESFETRVNIKRIGKFPCVFIRAPVIKRVFGKCKIFAKYKEYIVGAVQDNLLATSFHPELTNNTRVHEYFLEFF